MKHTNLIVISVLTAILLSGTFISLAAAQEDRVPDPSAVPDPAQLDSANNPTASPDDGVLYTIQDNRTIATDDPLPPDASGAENPNLIATNTAPDNTTAMVAIGVVLAVILVGVVGVVYYQRKSKAVEA